MGSTVRFSQFTPHDAAQYASHGNARMFRVDGDTAQAFGNFIDSPG